MNPLHTRWLTMSREGLVSSARTHPDWPLANKAIDALTMALAKTKEIIIAEEGDIPFFIHVLTQGENGTRASLITPGDADSVSERLDCEDAECKDLIAAFLVEFPNAAPYRTLPNGTIKGPIFMLDGNHRPQLVTVNNMKMLVHDRIKIVW